MPDTTKNAANQDARQAVFTAQEAPDSARVTTEVLTAAMKQQLRERGFSHEQIKNDSRQNWLMGQSRRCRQ